MAQLSLSFTKAGWETLALKGLTNSIKYYSFSDGDNVYGVTATNNLLPNTTGSHVQITDSYCAKAEYNGMFPNKPLESEISNTRTRLSVFFNNVDCSTEFTKSNLSLRVNITEWLSELESAVWSYNMSESLTQKLWSYISAKVENLDLTINDYTPVNTVTNFKLTYSPSTPEDYKKYQLLSPKYVKTNTDGTKMLVNVGTERYSSPFVLSFSNENITGDFIFGTSGLLSLRADTWGYWDGTNFRSLKEVEDSDASLYENIFPAVMIGNEYYYLPTTTDYGTNKGLIGYMMNMVNTKDSNKTALKALIERAVLFFKTNGTLTPDGRYVINMNFNVIPVNQTTNNITKVVGNNLNLELYYKAGDNSSIIQLIN